MKRKPLVAALVAVFVLGAVAFSGPSEPARTRPGPETFQRVFVEPLETTIELTR